ncbi:glucokinase [Nocardioides luteus]|uniref:Glucokinase n=1 Tax=Nocardioides luteus TaxID=1844 RepID=A0ABQ5SY62_9ACTN|nr:ROK family protein [Nocardioides luteus]MDR7312252.1 glucokinase [Nocardioides luteus]GGR57028.1 glucokinase [Nocardioides luteus]GLJ68498.1 glucokinase [Nocardioides luteus]
MTTVAAVDVGGTAIKYGLLRGDVLEPEPEIPTPLRGPDTAEEVVDVVAQALADLRRRSDFEAVGLVVPGYVDAERGVAIRSENLGWRDVPFRDQLAERVGLPVAFGHDVRAGALAEARLGAARGLRDVLVVPIGTGIAAGLVIDGRLHERPGPFGEIGHLDAGHERRCVCGRTGCLEAIASAAAISRAYVEQTGHPATAAEVAARVGEGDPAASLIWQEAVEALAATLAPCITLLAPGAVVIGGGLARAGDLLLRPLRRALERHTPVEVELRPAALGTHAGCTGAGLLALDLLRAAEPA